ncbi:MAG: hypothetical protein Q3961_04900 [Bifidobacteriaceae bacterium]|nr:hypothetical protein [Bifidobacteriaceae bacterium]
MHELLDAEMIDPISCVADSTSAYSSIVVKNKKVTKTLLSRMKKIKTAVKEVNKSHNSWSLANALQELNQTISSAQNTLTSSENLVADNTVREQLQNDITSAQQIADKSDVRDVKTYTDAKATLENDIATVNQSMATLRNNMRKYYYRK